MVKPISPFLVLMRAGSAVNRGTKYHLGHGGRHPAAALPGDRNNECDCSGFVAWAFGLDRKNNREYSRINGEGWISTDAIHQDVSGNQQLLFVAITDRRPGALLVYPDQGKRAGHMGIVVNETQIVHCSSTNAKSGDAIQLTEDRPFRGRSDVVLAWYLGFSQNSSSPFNLLFTSR